MSLDEHIIRKCLFPLFTTEARGYLINICDLAALAEDMLGSMVIAIMLNEEVVTLSPRKGTFENKFLLRHGSESGLVMNSSRVKGKKKKNTG